MTALLRLLLAALGADASSIPPAGRDFTEPDLRWLGDVLRFARRQAEAAAPTLDEAIREALG